MILFLETKEKLGDRIKIIRGNLSLSEFGEKLSMNSKNVIFDKSHLSKYERGLVRPGTDFYIALSETFFIDLNWLLTGKGLEFNPEPPDFNTDKLTKYINKAE